MHLFGFCMRFICSIAWKALPLKAAEPTGSFEDLAALGRKPAVHVHVDLAKGLAEASLQTLPSSCWPEGTLADALASEAAALTRNYGVEKPFVHVDLRKWVPFWAVTEPDAGHLLLCIEFCLVYVRCLCFQILMETRQFRKRWPSSQSAWAESSSRRRT